MGTVAQPPPLKDPAGIMTLQEEPADHVAAWTRLWRSGIAHSCSSGIPGNYDGAILEFWRKQFGPLGEGGLVVDVGTGNGAIPLLALSHARQRGIPLDIHGVDLADIDPIRDVPDGARIFHGVRFHARTPMSALPFGDGSVDLLCAHFAYEYAPRPEAAREILRVIGSRGRAALVVHSSDSVIARVSRAQQDACRWLLGDSLLLPATGQLLRAMAGAATPEARASLTKDPAAEAARLAFNRAAEELLARIEENPDAEILQRAAQRVSRLLAGPIRDRDEAQRILDGLRAWVGAESERLALMQSAAMDGDALAETVGLLGASALPVRAGKLIYGDGVCMGWTLVVGDE